MGEKEFLFHLIDFYKDNLLGLSKTVDKLANLQRDFKEEYELIKQITFNPSALPDILQKLNDESRGILINIYLKQDVLAKKSAMLFQMNETEKRTFSTEIAEFSKLVDAELKKLAEKAKA